VHTHHIYIHATCKRHVEKGLIYIVSSGLVDVFCDVFVALRILVSIPVSNHCAGRAFLLWTQDHQKLLALYNESTASLWHSSAPHWKRYICKNLLKDDIIDKFTAAKGRKAPFCQAAITG